MDIIMIINAFKYEKIFNQKYITNFEDDFFNFFGEIECLYWKIKNFSSVEIFQILINRIFYIFDEVEKICDTEEIKPKGRKTFLNYV